MAFAMSSAIEWLMRLVNKQQQYSGDTLFLDGCGRTDLPGSDPALMYESLSILSGLPDDTVVYCAHEYTASNVKFALGIEPDNAALQARAKQVEALRAEGKPTIPVKIGIVANEIQSWESHAVMSNPSSHSMVGQRLVAIPHTQQRAGGAPNGGAGK